MEVKNFVVKEMAGFGHCFGGKLLQNNQSLQTFCLWGL